MTRFQKLAAATVATTFLLVIVGVIVRSTESGMGCPDWPACNGALVPIGQDMHAWLEWIHRDIAAILGFMVLGLAVLAWLGHRQQRSILWPSVAAILLVGFQAWLGKQTVALDNSGESVTAHLASAMALVALLIYILVRSFYPARIGGRGASQRFTLVAALGAITTYALLLFGSHVTATDAALIFPDWPLMGGTAFPPVTGLTEAQVLHRYVAVVVGLITVGVWIVAWRTQRQHRAIVALATLAAICFPIQSIIGAFQIWTQLAPWTQTLHLALGSFIWGAMAALAFVSYYAARTT
ncbi:MAG: COX15/CtaA family protein, partial [Candidatus Limnocylindrales bacterium]